MMKDCLEDVYHQQLSKPSISSLVNYHKLPEVAEYLSLYLIKLYIGIAMLICSASSIKVSLTCSTFSE